VAVKTLTIRLPAHLLAEIAAEGRRRRISKADVVRERLSTCARGAPSVSFKAIVDLIGAVHGLPADLSANVRAHLRRTGYGRKRAR
jgi:hypothetical protein